MANMTFTIPDEKLDEFKKCFLAEYPNITVDGITPMTDNQWIHYRIEQFMRNAYRKGMKAIWSQTNKPPYDDTIIS